MTLETTKPISDYRVDKQICLQLHDGILLLSPVKNRGIACIQKSGVISIY